jgi:hypothetical protein
MRVDCCFVYVQDVLCSNEAWFMTKMSVCNLCLFSFELPVCDLCFFSFELPAMLQTSIEIALDFAVFGGTHCVWRSDANQAACACKVCSACALRAKPRSNFLARRCATVLLFEQFCCRTAQICCMPLERSQHSSVKQAMT